MFLFEKSNQYFAQCPGKMEELAIKEIKDYGITDIKSQYRGFYFSSDLEHLMRINYRARLLSRILAPLIIFDCHSEKYLFTTAKKLEWDRLLRPDESFAIFSNVANSNISHSQYATQVLKDAIADYFKDKYGERPSVERHNPDVWINLFINRNRATISLDISGGPLHKRGYRLESVAAPMQETLAAALINISDWNGEQPLWDPFCGSGTILSEALLEYARIPTGFKRTSYGFEKMPDFDQSKWNKIKDDGERLKRPLPDDLIYGSDISEMAVKAAKTNLNSIPFGHNVNIAKMDFRNSEGFENGVIITNPPYGVRLGETEALRKLYKEFGDFLKRKCSGTTAYVYCGNTALIKDIGLKPEKKIQLINGNLDGRLLKISIY